MSNRNGSVTPVRAPGRGRSSHDQRQSARNEVTVGRVREPDVAECDPTQRWLTRSESDGITFQHSIRFRFYKRDGEKSTTLIPQSWRSSPNRILATLESLNARLPSDRRVADEFVKALVLSIPTKAVIACTSPSFVRGATGFVMPGKLYGSAVGPYVWNAQDAPRQFGAIQGDLKDYSRGVLIPALSSPYLTLGIAVGLAGALLGYAAQKNGNRVLPETAIIHFAGETSSGKTTTIRVCQSVFGSPDVEMDYQASDPGLAEHAYRRNNLALIIDDTESGGQSDRAVVTKMQRIAQSVPSGRGRVISRRAAGRFFTDLKWTCFGVSSGPETLAELCDRLGVKLKGERVRFLDLKLPPLEDGGIFGSDVVANLEAVVSDSAVLVDKIEATITKHHGVLFDAWIDYLLANDVMDEFEALILEFVEATATGSNGMEKRFARKFGVLFAALKIGVKAGLLPWPDDWPMRAIHHCYMNSRGVRDPDGAKIEASICQLARSLNWQSRFCRFKLSRGTRPLWLDQHVGLRVHHDGKVATWVCQDRLDRSNDDWDFSGSRVFERLCQMGMIQKKRGSTQFRVRLDTGQVTKVRFWRLNAKKLKAWKVQTVG
jgi:Domain of unknown function (DUF927)